MNKTLSTLVNTDTLLQRLYSRKWVEGEFSKKVYVRYYLLPFDLDSNFHVPGMDNDVVTYADTEFKVVIAHISDQKYTSHFLWLIHADANNRKIDREVLDRKLPAANYVLVTTKILGADDRAYMESSIKMDGFVANLRLLGGNNLLRQLVREGILDVSTGNIDAYSSAAPEPNKFDGPFAEPETWKSFYEISTTISNHQNKARIELAFQLIERAFLADTRYKFISYWIAFEVVAGTHNSPKILAQLAKAYGKKNTFIQNTLGFDHLKNTRTAIIHNGESYEMSSHVERFMQDLFLDLVRENLGLKCLEYMANAVAQGFDINQLDKNIGQAKILTIE